MAKENEAHANFPADGAEPRWTTTAVAGPQQKEDPEDDLDRWTMVRSAQRKRR